MANPCSGCTRNVRGRYELPTVRRASTETPEILWRVRHCAAASGRACTCPSRRTPPAHRHVLRHGRFDRDRGAPRSRGFSRCGRGVSSLRRRKCYATGRVCRPLHGQRRADLFRLSCCQRGRRRMRGACSSRGRRGGSSPGHRCGAPSDALCAGRNRNGHGHRWPPDRCRRVARKGRCRRLAQPRACNRSPNRVPL